MSAPHDNPPVNRYLKDKELDQVDHALGRPVWPLRESYRNHYATEAGGEIAIAFDQSAHWKRGGTHGRMAFYHVTQEGRAALAEHLTFIPSAKAFVVRYQRHESIIPAATAAKARYAYFRLIREVCPDLTFVEFATDARVRAA